MRGNRFGMNQLPHYNFNHSSNKIPSAPLEGKSKILQWQQSLKSKHKNSTKGNIIPLIINTLYVTSCFKGRTSDATKINLFFHLCKYLHIILIISRLSISLASSVEGNNSVSKNVRFLKHKNRSICLTYTNLPQNKSCIHSLP